VSSKSPIRTLVFAALSALATALPAYAQTWQPPAEAARCPSPWGAGDERGAGNLQGPERVLRALGLVRAGRVFELGHVLNADIPLSPWRQFSLHTKRTTADGLSNQRGSNEELVVSELGHVGTQFDGFAHQTIGDSLYNCFKASEIATRDGFARLGIEKVGAIVTRGVLIDVAALKGVAMLPDTYEITVEDLEQALSTQGLALERGDAVIIHTGWGTLWGENNARFQATNPGIGIAATEWLAARQPILVGADTSPVEVRPNPDPEISLPTHQLMLAVHGIHLLENLKLDELAAARVHEFALIVQPLKLEGATGSTVAPIAIR
jgi:kynurenine formamidase